MVLLPRGNAVDSLSVSNLLVSAAPAQHFQLSESFQVRGHTRCTRSYLLSGADQPECMTRQCPLTVSSTFSLNILILMILETNTSLLNCSRLFFGILNVLDIMKETNFYNRYAVTRREDRLSLQISSTVTSDAGSYVCGDLLTPTSTCAAVLGVLGT